MSNKFMIEVDVAKKLADDIKAFSTSKNAVRLKIGYKPAVGENIPSEAIVVDGGNMLEKGFYAKEVDGEVFNGSVNLKSAEFINNLLALIAYEENIVFTVEEASVIMEAGKQASLVLPITLDVEPELEVDVKSAAQVAINVTTEKFLTLAQKGCFLGVEDIQNIADRYVLKIEFRDGGILTGYSTDRHAFAFSSVALQDEDTKRATYCIMPAFYIERLKKKAQSLDSDEKQRIENEIAAAEKGNPSDICYALERLAIKEQVDISEMKFSILCEPFSLIEKLIKGTKYFQLAVTDTYCVIQTDTSRGVFTLGSTIPAFYDNGMGMFIENSPLAGIVVDTQLMQRALSLIFLSKEARDNKVVVHLWLDAKGLHLEWGDNAAIIEFVEKEGDLDKVDCYMSPVLLSKVISSMDNGNLYIGFRTSIKEPLLFRNGSLDNTGKSLAVALQVNPPKDSISAKNDEKKNAEE